MMRTREFDQQAAHARAMLEKAAAAEASSAGPCYMCRWFYIEDKIMYEPGDRHSEFCRNPVVAAVEFEPIGGEFKPQKKRAEIMRSRGQLCGPDGLLFELSYLGAVNNTLTGFPRLLLIIMGFATAVVCAVVFTATFFVA